MRLKQKSKEEEELQKKASISVPLVAEHAEDVKTAKSVTFNSDNPSQEKRKRRLEIKTQSVFDTSSSSASGSSKKAHTLLVEARRRSGGGSVFKTKSGGGTSTQRTVIGGVRTKELRTSLGIRTTKT